MSRFVAKKWVVTVIALTLVILLLVPSCARPAPAPAPTPKPPPTPAPTSPAPALSPKPSPAPTPSPKPPPSPAPSPKAARIPFDKQELQKYVLGWASPGGIAWVGSTTLATIISKYTPMKGSVTLIPGIGNAVEPLRKGEVDYFWLSPPSSMEVYTGKFEPQGMKKLRLRYMVSPEGKDPGAYGVWALKSSDIKEGKDLKGKRIGVVPGTTWTVELPEAIMQAHGWTKNDYTQVDYGTVAAGFTALVEKKIHALVYVAGTQSLETAKTVGVRYLPCTKAETDAMLKFNPSFSAGMSPSNYNGIEDSVWGLLAFSGFWCRADLNEKTAYTMVKALFDNIKEFRDAHVRTADFSLQAAPDLVWSVPYHPGVIRYYQEMKVWKDEHTAKQRALIAKEKELYGDVIDEEAFKELGILR